MISPTGHIDTKRHLHDRAPLRIAADLTPGLTGAAHPRHRSREVHPKSAAPRSRTRTATTLRARPCGVTQLEGVETRSSGTPDPAGTLQSTPDRRHSRPTDDPARSLLDIRCGTWDSSSTRQFVPPDEKPDPRAVPGLSRSLSASAPAPCRSRSPTGIWTAADATTTSWTWRFPSAGKPLFGSRCGVRAPSAGRSRDCPVTRRYEPTRSHEPDAVGIQ